MTNGSAHAAPAFTVDEAVQELGFGVHAFCIQGGSNSATHPEFEERVRRAEKHLLSTTSLDTLKDERALGAFRELHSRVGREAKKERAAPEVLLRSLHRHGALPRINLIVDIYNLVSAETRLALGAHDLRHVDGDVRLTRTTGEERFVPLGSEIDSGVPPGEYAYVDSSNDVLCRMEVRQADKSKVGLDTTSCLYIIQGSPEHTEAEIDDARARLTDLITRYCGGQVVAASRPTRS